MRRAAVTLRAKYPLAQNGREQPNRGAAAPVASRGPARVCFQPFDRAPRPHDGRRDASAAKWWLWVPARPGWRSVTSSPGMAGTSRSSTRLTSWRRPGGERWESLRLFTSARYDALPGLAFPGDPDRYPSKDEVADYLAEYARSFDLPVELGSRGEARWSRINGTYLVELEGTARSRLTRS